MKLVPFTRDVAVKATAWVSVLLHARLKDDRTEVVRARRELSRLGVMVRFRRDDEKGGGA